MLLTLIDQHVQSLKQIASLNSRDFAAAVLRRKEQHYFELVGCHVDDAFEDVSGAETGYRLDLLFEKPVEMPVVGWPTTVGMKVTRFHHHNCLDSKHYQLLGCCSKHSSPFPHQLDSELDYLQKDNLLS